MLFPPDTPESSLLKPLKTNSSCKDMDRKLLSFNGEDGSISVFIDISNSDPSTVSSCVSLSVVIDGALFIS